MQRKTILLTAGLFCLCSYVGRLQAQSLAQALDTTGLVWTTNGNAGWISQTGANYDGADAAASGTLTHNQESVLETTVTNGPGVLSFWWKVYSEPRDDFKPGGDFLEFYINGVLQESISGEVDWQFRSYDIPAGNQTLSWKYAKDGSINFGTPPAGDRGWVDQVSFTTATPLPLGQALDSCGLVWTSGGNTNATYWSGLPNLTILGGITNLAHDGVDSAQSGAIFHNQASWMETTVTGATNVNFWWKVSSEPSSDFLQFYVNGVLKTNISGTVNWRQQSFALTTNSQTLRWRYLKDFAVSVGQDRGWVDQVVVIPNTAVPLPFHLTSPTVLPDGRFQLTLSSLEQCNCRILLSTNLTSWTTLTNFTSTNVSMTVVDSAAADFPIRFYQGVAP